MSAGVWVVVVAVVVALGVGLWRLATDGRFRGTKAVASAGADTTDTTGAADDTADVALVVGGETFRAHRAVLAARSPGFKAALFGSMAEATAPSVALRDMDPAAFRAVLHFIYTDALPDDIDELAEIADQTEASAEQKAAFPGPGPH